MKVKLIASTWLELDPDNDFRLSLQSDMSLDPDSTQAQDLIEFAGRACYQSFHKPNPATRKNADYIANIIKQGHESVLEHASATFYITGVSRALTHELIRHRHLSFSELSQRFVNVSDVSMVVPPALRDTLNAECITRLNEDESEIRDTYDHLVEWLTDMRGLTRKQAREAARAVMPNATETKIVVTGNHRAWRDAIGKRWHVAADREICELFGEILRQLREIAPAVYADIPEVPYGTED